MIRISTHAKHKNSHKGIVITIGIYCFIPEAVAGVVGRADILSCIFFVLSVISYTKASRFAFTLSSAYSPTNWKYFVLAVFFSVAAMLSKEIGITALAICLVYEVVFTIEPELKKLKETLWRVSSTLFVVEIKISSTNIMPRVSGKIYFFQAGTFLFLY